MSDSFVRMDTGPSRRPAGEHVRWVWLPCPLDLIKFMVGKWITKKEAQHIVGETSIVICIVCKVQLLLCVPWKGCDNWASHLPAGYGKLSALGRRKKKKKWVSLWRAGFFNCEESRSWLQNRPKIIMKKMCHSIAPVLSVCYPPPLALQVSSYLTFLLFFSGICSAYHLRVLLVRMTWPCGLLLPKSFVHAHLFYCPEKMPGRVCLLNKKKMK